jgi:SAM-dependent methyltransferase
MRLCLSSKIFLPGALIGLGLFFGTAAPVPAQIDHPYQHRGHRQHRFEDAEKWAKRFENPARDRWQRPEAVVAALELDSTSLVADIGSATGYFPVRFARVVTRGKVYGIDIEPDMVDYLNARAEREGLDNLTSILGRPEDPLIPEPVDIIFICNTYHHIQDRQQYFQNLKRYFRPAGALIIVDFKKGDLPVGPPDDMKLSPEEVVAELAAAGYRLVPAKVELPYQYFLRFLPEVTGTSP